jgi:hypothetical protein
MTYGVGLNILPTKLSGDCLDANLDRVCIFNPTVKKYWVYRMPNGEFRVGIEGRVKFWATTETG